MAKWELRAFHVDCLHIDDCSHRIPFLQVVEREECLLEKGLDALPDLRERIRINEWMFREDKFSLN